MKIQLICIGTMRDSGLRELVDRFSARIPHYMPFEVVSLPDVKATKALTPDLQKIREGEAILARVSRSDCMILFDERGRELTSREFADFISRKANTLGGNLCLVIGGPYGFSADVYSRADGSLCLSRMTFTHEMARFIAAEQIYRAMTILRNEPYHHD